MMKLLSAGPSPFVRSTRSLIGACFLCLFNANLSMGANDVDFYLTPVAPDSHRISYAESRYGATPFVAAVRILKITIKSDKVITITLIGATPGDRALTGAREFEISVNPKSTSGPRTEDLIGKIWHLVGGPVGSGESDVGTPPLFALYYVRTQKMSEPSPQWEPPQRNNRE